MKRLFISFLMAAICVAAVSAFQFKLAPDKPLFTEPSADPYSFRTRLSAVVLPFEADRDIRIRTLVRDVDTGKLFYDDLAYKDYDSSKKSYVNMKVAGTLNPFELVFDAEKMPKIQIQAGLSGYLNAVFCMFNSSACMGFDGSYFLNASAKVDERFVFRLGLHHFSGHYGDERLEQLFENNAISFADNSIGNYTGLKYEEGHSYQFVKTMEYVRDNSFLFGFEAELPKGFRVYSEFEIPTPTAYVRPFNECPAEHKGKNVKSYPHAIAMLAKYIWWTDPDVVQNEKDIKEGTAYHAIRIHGGAEWTKDLSFGKLVLSVDVQAHQDGQTLHDLGTYKPSNHWEFELSAGAALELAELGDSGHAVRLEACFRDGRYILSQFHYKRARSFSIGFGVN